MDSLDDELAQRRLRAMVHERLFGAPAPPLQIGRYRVIRRLGVGAMGAVYAARDPQLGRLVALKVLHGHLDGDAAEARARLHREARALARLSHPNVVAVHEVGAHEGQIFVAMEYVDGVTLGAWIRDARPSWRAIVRAFIAAGRGLQAAHAAGLVHRDFKPDNVLVDGAGRARVLDFGLSRPEAGRASGATCDGDELGPLTRSGVIVGTPAYMSPEQLRGEALDPRSDLFSFCVALYEALLGHRPFDLLHEAGIRGAALGTAAPQASGPRLPRRLRRALSRGLERDRARRFPAMEPLLRELEISVTPAIQRWEPRIAGFVGVAALAGLVAIGARAEGPATRGAPVLPRVAHLRLVGEHARVRSADAAGSREATRSGRDRRRLAIAGELVDVDPSAAAVVLAGLEAPARLAGDPELARLVDAILGEPLAVGEAWAPAGARVAVTGGSVAWILAGEAAARVDLGADDPTPEPIRPRGVVRLAVADDAAFLALADGGVERWIHGAAAAERCASPGPAIVDLRARGGHAAWLRADGTIMVHAADAGARLWTTLPGGEALALSPGGSRIAVRHGATFEVLGGRASVRVEHPGAVAFAVAESGALATATARGEVRIWSAAGRRVATLGPGAGAPLLEWSADERLAIAAGDALRIWAPGRGEAPVLHGHQGRIRALAWGPDDALVSGDEGGVVRIWSLRSGQVEAILRGHRAEIVGVSLDAGGDQILTHSADGDLRRWRRDGVASTILERRDRDLSAIAVEAGGERRASAGVDGVLHLWSGDRGGGERPPDHRVRCGAAVQALALGRSWVAGGDDRGHLCALRWAGAGAPEPVGVRGFAAGGRPITALALAPGERWLAVGDSDGGVRLVDLEAPAARPRTWRRARRGGAWIMSLSFEPGDGRLLAAAADGGLWIGAPESAPEALPRPGGGLRGASWVAPGGPIVVAGDDGWIRRIRLDPGAPARDEGIGHHPAAIWDLAPSPDGSRIASAGADGRVLLWPRAAGEAVMTLTGHRGEVLDLAFEAGGDHLLSAGEDGSGRRWPLRLEDRLARLAALVRVCVAPAAARALSELDDAAAPVCPTPTFP